jgi:hypothetical protein
MSAGSYAKRGEVWLIDLGYASKMQRLTLKICQKTWQFNRKPNAANRRRCKILA